MHRVFARRELQCFVVLQKMYRYCSFHSLAIMRMYFSAREMVNLIDIIELSV
jgi:hypothetical protein